MSVWSARRFWSDVTIRPEGDGFTVLLDSRPVRTPLKAPLILPTEGLAQAVATEWQAQDGKVKPETMPFTRTSNSAIDKVAPQFPEVADMLAAYGASDLLCYRATEHEGLIARQSAGWDPLLHWAATTLRAPLIATAGVMHIDQPPESLARLQSAVFGLSPFQLAAFHDLVAISGSLVLAFAVTHGHVTPEEAWSLSRIDENWQIEEWGEDEEAAEMARYKHEAFLQAARFYGLCG